jgi:hypothetical protein
MKIPYALQPMPAADGAPVTCCFATVVSGEVWSCPSHAVGILTETDFNEVNTYLNKSTSPILRAVSLAGRAVCHTHRESLWGFVEHGKEYAAFLNGTKS